MPRPRKPNNVHVLNGTYRQDRHGPPTVAVPTGEPEKPQWLSERASAEWDRVAKLLTEAGFLAGTDADALATYCELFAEFQNCPQAMQTARIQTMRVLMHEMGMTPSSRDKVAAGKKADANPFGQL